MKIKVSAPGKIHLSGEHSVVYGEPALLCAIDRRLTVVLKQRKDEQVYPKTELIKFGIKKIYQLIKKKPRFGFDLEIYSSIPVGAGLGSSAALAVALTGAILKLEGKSFNKEVINKIAYEMEKKQHRNPSGGDNTTVCFGGLIKFQKIANQFKFNHLKIPTQLTQFLLINSGKPKESTGEMVHFVNLKLKTKNLKEKTQNTIKKIGKVTNQVINCFQFKKFKSLKSLITENERLLEDLGVVGEKAKKIIKLIEEKGGAGKICGAGGIKKGSGMILGYHQDASYLKSVLKSKGLKFMDIKLGEEGVTVDD